MMGWSEEIRFCDVLVVGGGGAGLRAAIAAKLCDTDVLLVSKMKVGSTSNTYISKAVIASTGWGPPDDNAGTHMADTVKGGRFLNDQAMVAQVTERSHAEVQFLQECGVHFSMHANKPRVIETPGHQHARHIYGENWRGSDLVIPLKRRAKQIGVRFAEQVYVSRLLADDARIGGATGITPDGRFFTIHAKVVVLATGGYAQIYINTNQWPKEKIMTLNIDYTDKTVVVVGGTSGINRGIAELFAEHGADVAVASRNPDKVDNTVSSLKKCGVKAMGFSADVRDFDALVAGVDDVKMKMGEFDVVVSGAAGNFPAMANDLSPNGFKSVVDIDLRGTFHVMRAIFPHLKKPGASVINISAPQALIPMIGQIHVF